MDESLKLPMSNGKMLHIYCEDGKFQTTCYGKRQEDGATVTVGSGRFTDAQSLLKAFSAELDPRDIITLRNKFSI